MGALTGAGAAPSLIWHHPCDVTSQAAHLMFRHYPRLHPRGGPSSLRQPIMHGSEVQRPCVLAAPVPEHLPAAEDLLSTIRAV